MLLEGALGIIRMFFGARKSCTFCTVGTWANGNGGMLTVFLKLLVFLDFFVNYIKTPTCLDSVVGVGMLQEFVAHVGGPNHHHTTHRMKTI